LLFRFLHYSIEDEEHYRKYGEFPIGQEIPDQQFNISGNQNIAANLQQQQHQQQQQQQQVEYQSEFSSFFNGSSSSNSNRSIPSLLDGDLFHSCQQRHDTCCHNDRGSSVFSNGNSVFRNGLKRMNSQDCMQQNFKRCREDDIMVVLRRFDEEHQMLKRRVEANELKIAELRASNEYLMTQNAQLRMATVQVSRVVNPVTVTQTQSHQQAQGPQLISAQCHSQLVTTPIVSMSAPQQLIATPQNMSNVPTLALTNTSQATQQILGTTQQICLPAPTISTPINTISINTSQALQAAISNASQPIISYPIMTHSILPH
jgi:hypothetical protein